MATTLVSYSVMKLEIPMDLESGKSKAGKKASYWDLTLVSYWVKLKVKVTAERTEKSWGTSKDY